MSLPRNKYTLFAAVWFVLLWIALLREGGANLPLPFPHFDKAAHFAAFFAQFWLVARAWLAENRRPPAPPLFAAAVLAVTTETAQAYFTANRSADILDALADLAGTAAAALWLAAKFPRSGRQDEEAV